MKKIILSLLIMMMSILWLSPKLHASGDPGFTVYAFTASDTTHTLPSVTNWSNAIVIVDGVLVLEYGVNKLPLIWEIVINTVDVGMNGLYMYDLSGGSLDLYFDENGIVANEANREVLMVFFSNPSGFNTYLFRDGDAHNLSQDLSLEDLTVIVDGGIIDSFRLSQDIGISVLLTILDDNEEEAIIFDDTNTIDFYWGNYVLIIEATEQAPSEMDDFVTWIDYPNYDKLDVDASGLFNDLFMFWQHPDYDNRLYIVPNSEALYIGDGLFSVYNNAFATLSGDTIPSYVEDGEFDIEHIFYLGFSSDYGDTRLSSYYSHIRVDYLGDIYSRPISKTSGDQTIWLKIVANYAWIDSETYQINDAFFYINNVLVSFISDEVSIYLEKAPDPIYVLESIDEPMDATNQDAYGYYIEVEGLFQLSDIKKLAVYWSLPIITDFDLGRDNTLGDFNYNLTYIDNEVLKYHHPTLGVIDLAWVRPGKLYLSGFFADTAWPYDNNPSALPIKLDYIYRSPGITGTTVFVTNVDSPITEAQIRASITAFDETDGDITHKIVKSSDNYSNNMNTVGQWNIVYSITDSSSNTETLTVVVFVRDVVAPVVDFGEYDDVTISYTVSFNPLTHANNFTITDNYYDLEDLDITADVGNYQGGPGSYTITYTIIDPSGNRIDFEISLTVIDDVAPVITGPETITTTVSSGLALGNILSQYSATDAITGGRSITVVTDNYSPNKGIGGTYTIVLRATDTSGNVAQRTIEIVVTDDVVPVFYVTNAFISVAESITLTLEDIIRILYVTGQIDDMESFNLSSSTYFGNELNPGIYNVVLTDGVRLLSLTINVDAHAPILFAIQFNSTGGSFISNIIIARGQTATRPEDPTRDGYTFGGWFKDEYFVNEMNWTSAVNDDIMLYAKWIPQTQTVNFGMIAFYIGIGLVVLGFGAILIKKKVR